jgi:hypothetical protein
MTTSKQLRIAVAALALSVAGVASAQNITGQVVGRVLDAETGKPVVGATVTATSAAWIPQSVRTNSSGYYVLSLLPPNHYEVAVQAPGYLESRPRDIQVMIDWRIKNDVRVLSASAGKGPEPERVAQNR